MERSALYRRALAPIMLFASSPFAFVVSAIYTRPSDIEYRLYHKQYTDAYRDLAGGAYCRWSNVDCRMGQSMNQSEPGGAAT